MRSVFKLSVKAKTVSAAATAARKADKRAARKTNHYLIEDPKEAVLQVIAGKLKRVRCNPSLYDDRIKELEGVEAALIASSTPEGIADAILGHGDLRVDNAGSFALIKTGSDQYLAFGFDYGDPPSATMG